MKNANHKPFWEQPEEIQTAVKQAIAELPKGWQDQTTQGIIRRYILPIEIGHQANSQIDSERQAGLEAIEVSAYVVTDEDKRIFDVFNSICPGTELAERGTTLGKCIDIILPFSQWHSSNVG